MSALRPPGAAATVVGGLLGAAGGFGIGLVIAYVMPVDDNAGLEALGTFLLVVFLATCLAGGVGAGVALGLRHHTRAGLTSVLAIFGLIAALLVTLRWFGDQNSTLATAMLLVDFAVTLYFVRVIAMLGGRGLGIREE